MKIQTATMRSAIQATVVLRLRPSARAGYLLGPILLLLLIGLPRVDAHADELVLQSGDTLVGVIVASTRDSVAFTHAESCRQYAHEDVAVYRFQHADVVQLISGERIERKIMRKENDRVLMIGPAGVEQQFNPDIKKVWYNRGGPLSTPSITMTGAAFHPGSSGPVRSEAQGRALLFGLRIGSHYASLGDWRDQFAGFSDNTVPIVLLVGGEIQATVTPALSLGGGVEYLHGPGVKVVTLPGEPTDRPTAWLAFGTLYLSTPLRSNPFARFGGAVDIGYLWATESLSAGSNSLTATSQTLMVRPKFRAQVRYGDRFVLHTELGLLIANAAGLEMSDGTRLNYDLDFTGVSITIGLMYDLAR